MWKADLVFMPDVPSRHIVLIIISFFCLFWFYIMFINATRSKGELKAGFTALPSDHLLTNWNNLVHGTLPIWQSYCQQS